MTVIRSPIWVVLAALGVPASASAQDTGLTGAEGAMETARQAYTADDAGEAAEACEARQSNGEIVVCAAPESQEPYRYSSNPAAQARYAAATARKGDPAAPDFRPPPCVPSLLTYCSNKGPLERPLMIDLAAIPEAPAGSDAERVGRGLAPAEAGAAAVSPPGSASPAGPQ